MTDSSDIDDTQPSPLLTYVVFRDQLDQEHAQLYTALHRVLLTCERDEGMADILEQLTLFVNLLTQHHETENAILQVVRPEQWAVHIRVHNEIGALAVGILERAKALDAVSPPEIRKLLAILEKHIDTMDHELSDAVNN